MKRIPSTLALAAWIGFVVMSVAFPSMTAAAGVPAGAFQSTGIAAMIGAAASVASACFVVTMFAVSLVFLHTPGGAEGNRRAKGETLALLGFATLGIAASFGWILNVGPLSTEAASMPFWGLLALSCGAVLFDRAITVEDADDADEDFDAAIGAIAQSMARQTYLYSGRGPCCSEHGINGTMDRTR